MFFSFIIPVFNRPDEVDELLASLLHQSYDEDFEVLIIEDGSTNTCKSVVEKYSNTLQISYYFKENSGPGASRNFGMQKANGDYFIILDSDCILPPNYITEVATSLTKEYVDCYGGPDAAHQSFSTIQKAINFTMTSFLTTGGIRGKSESLNKFQPRSFNMGLSKMAFEKSGGFGTIHPGEDPDLTLRLWDLGIETKLISRAFVYHKRRINWNKFYTQVHKFGKARPILNLWHANSAKLTYWFPSFFCLGFLLSILLLCFHVPFLLYLYAIYFGILFVSSTVQNKSLKIGFFSLIATFIQFFGYGLGFLKSYFKICIVKQKPEIAFPELFFLKK
ncbi:glycosyltransferase family 2 protein [Flavobacterium sp.]|uniref:glycosyltransferase n=1 Tax=Flavobacterium sp. TaxID=239 RepID=UPI0035272924